jgi:hypothetical protein
VSHVPHTHPLPAAGWGTAAAWSTATWPAIYSFYPVPAAPIDYDYGNTVVYQGNNVNVQGQDEGTAANYARQAVAIAGKGQSAEATPDQEWKPLGVFARVQGEEKDSNYIFQLALNKEGVIRGNYYDGMMDSTTPIKKSQRAAWTIGKKQDRIFETGIYNLTKPETPVLVHFGKDKTQQWLLVRMEKPKEGQPASR